MAKFNDYGFEANDDEGVQFATGTVTAQNKKTAWLKAVAEMFDAIEPGTGRIPATLYVWRKQSASEHHG